VKTDLDMNIFTQELNKKLLQMYLLENHQTFEQTILLDLMKHISTNGCVEEKGLIIQDGVLEQVLLKILEKQLFDLNEVMMEKMVLV
jgi:hypothetical protein